jgi:hypothetical protein
LFALGGWNVGSKAMFDAMNPLVERGFVAWGKARVRCQ